MKFSLGEVMRARVEWRVSRELRADVDVVALDTTDDRVTNYDAYVIETEERELPLEGGWFAVEKQSHGSWSKILDADALDVTLYWGAISRTNAYPETFRALLDEEEGGGSGRIDFHGAEVVDGLEHTACDEGRTDPDRHQQRPAERPLHASDQVAVLRHPWHQRGDSPPRSYDSCSSFGTAVAIGRGASGLTYAV